MYQITIENTTLFVLFDSIGLILEIYYKSQNDKKESLKVVFDKTKLPENSRKLFISSII